MTPLDFFKLQAKNLFRDFKTQTTQLTPKVAMIFTITHQRISTFSV